MASARIASRTRGKGNRKRKQKASSPSTTPAAALWDFLRSSRGSEVIGVVGLGTSIFLFISLLSLQIGDSQWMGPFGQSFAAFAYSVLGLGTYFSVVVVAVACVFLLMDREPPGEVNHVIGALLGLVSLAILIHLVGSGYRVAGFGPGGLLGEYTGEFLRSLVSTAGTVLIAVMGLIVAAVVATPLRMRSVVLFLLDTARAVADRMTTGVRRIAADAGHFVAEVVRAILPERDHDAYLDFDEEEYDDEEEQEDSGVFDPPIIDARSGPIAVPQAELAGDTEKVDEAASKADKPKKEKKSRAKKTTSEIAKTGEEEQAEETAEPVIVESVFRSAKAAEIKERTSEVDEERLEFIKLADGEYQLPALDLLAFDENRDSNVDRKAMFELSAKLVKTLENYGVKGGVVAIRPGPVVTMYEFAPAPGTRLNKIVNLADDLAMSLEAMKVRIVAPIPGKAAVGIEVPNKSKETVYLKEILTDTTFRDRKHKLPMALGKDIEGAPNTLDLAKMPHLLVAGTTGSGKSVSVNSMIMSLLYSSTPEEVRLIMIDPKMLELSIYEGVPHLLLPVVTDPKKANLALRWAVDEMERRYGLLARMGVRDIRTYNTKIEKERARWEADRLQRMADEAKRIVDEDEEDPVEETGEHQPDLPFDAAPEEPPSTLPFIVVVIDEFADLMMCAPKEVETSVARIAQKARAAGIHLILATQRPSVDVITGLIKANFPSRIAFRVSSKVDSRTILDQGGAENLLGSGDMLFTDRGAEPVRLHGCFVDEDEIHGVVSFLKTQGKPVYNLDIVKPRDEDEEEGDEQDGIGDSADALYDKAVAIVAESQRVSVSYIQRRLSVGYNRAAKMVERMEREGVVSAPDNKKQREVLVAAA